MEKNEKKIEQKSEVKNLKLEVERIKQIRTGVRGGARALWSAK